MKKLFIFILFSFFSITRAQFEFPDEDSSSVKCEYPSLKLGIASTGICFGNSEKWNGIRINVSDCNVKEVNGVNITLWNPKNNPDLKVKGIAVGLAPAGKSINGISIGLGAVVGKKELKGINVGGIAAVGGSLEGINLGGIALVGKEKIYGINIGGIATVAKGNISGFNLGGLAVVSNQNIIGINVGGLATISKGEMYGLNLGGLAVISQANICGINFAGIGIVSKGNILGINLGGLALVSNGNIYGLNQSIIGTISKNSVKGINVSGYKLEAGSFYGINFTAGWTELNNLNGISISSFHKIDGTQRGIVIGILNIAEELKGFQFGLINIAKNNKGITKVLPLINCHF